MANENSNSEYHRIVNQLLSPLQSPLAKDSSLEWKDQSETEAEEASVHKDRRCRAIMAMNFAALSTTGMMASFKYIAAEGYHAADFNLLRNVVGLLITTIWTRVLIGLNPFKTFPLHYKGWMLVRLVCGQANFILLNVASTLASISLTLVIWQTSPFWISILAYFLLNESIYRIEIVSKLICFGAVILIAT